MRIMEQSPLKDTDGVVLGYSESHSAVWLSVKESVRKVWGDEVSETVW